MEFEDDSSGKKNHNNNSTINGYDYMCRADLKSS